MAGSIGETAKLVASLELKDHFSGPANKAAQSLGKLESRAFRAGQAIGKGFKNAARNLRNIGVVAAAGIAFEVKQGLSSLAALETATTSVTGAIKQMGQSGQVTSAQVATWANEIEASVQAAFDDKEITAAAATLVRFGKVAPSNLRQALVVMTDLAAKTGSVDSAATLLGKALSDPAKAAGKLARQGVILTKTQQDELSTILNLTDAERERFIALGKQDAKAALRYRDARLAEKQAKAQNFILQELAKTTKGAAAASVGEYGDALNMLEDATEDAQRALAIGFFPIIKKVSNLLSTELAKPSTIAAIRSFGETLAGAFDSVLELAKRIPWGTIGSSLKIAGEGAKTLLNAFTSLPDWVQTAVITGWGLNKLTGGVLGDVVGGLAKGLASQVFGAIGIKAGIVNVSGPVAGLPGGGGPGLPGIGTVAGGAALGAGAGVAIVGLTAASIAGIGLAIDSQIDPHDLLKLRGQAQTATARGVPDANNKPLQKLREIEQGLDRANSTSTTQAEKTRSAFNVEAEKQKAAIAAAAQKSTTDAERIKSSATVNTLNSTSQIVGALGNVVTAVNGIDVSVQATTINKVTAKQTYYGPVGGSRNAGKASTGFGGQ